MILEIAKLLEKEKVIDLKNPYFHPPSWLAHYEKILKLIKLAKSKFPRAKVLDVGIGYGIPAVCAADMSLKVVATEHPTIIKDGVKKIAQRKNINLVLNDLREGLPFKDGSFDMVLCCDVIEHLEAPTVLLLFREIRRCLKDKGGFILTTPNLSRFSNVIRLILGKRINPPLIPDKVGGVFDHVREFSLEEVKRLMEENGFVLDVVETGVIKDFILTSRRKIKDALYLVNRLISRFVTTLGDEIYILAWKV